MLLIGYSLCSSDYKIQLCSYRPGVAINALPRFRRLCCWECFDKIKNLCGKDKDFERSIPGKTDIITAIIVVIKTETAFFKLILLMHFKHLGDTAVIFTVKENVM